VLARIADRRRSFSEGATRVWIIAIMTASRVRIRWTVQIARREIILDESDDALALLIFEIYQNQCRHWLTAAKRTWCTASPSCGAR
jgi:hypothetical protein